MRLSRTAFACLALALGVASTFARANPDGALSDTDASRAPRDIEEGRRAYEGCTACHGEDGGGRADGTFPRIAGQHRTVIMAQLDAIRNGTRPNPIMEPHANALLDEEQVAQVAAYVAALAFRGEAGLGPGDDLERGEQLYGSDCAGCHGKRGQGDGARLVPAVAGQHFDYLLRRARSLGSWGQLRHPSEGRPLEEYTDSELRAVADFAGRLPEPTPPRPP